MRSKPLIFSFLFLIVFSKFLLSSDLKISDKLIENATKYGLKKEAISETNFLAPWLARPSKINIVSIDSLTIATIFTPFMQFAYFTYSEKRGPNNDEKKNLSDSVDKALGFRILCFGKTINFPNKSKVELRINKNKILSPIKYGTTKIELIENGYFDDNSQAYGGVIYCSFEKKDIKNDDFLELILFEGSRKLKLIYSFDLKKIK